MGFQVFCMPCARVWIVFYLVWDIFKELCYFLGSTLDSSYHTACREEDIKEFGGVLGKNISRRYLRRVPCKQSDHMISSLNQDIFENQREHCEWFYQLNTWVIRGKLIYVKFRFTGGSLFLRCYAKAKINFFRFSEVERMSYLFKIIENFQFMWELFYV